MSQYNQCRDTLKAMEQILFQALRRAFSQLLAQILAQVDHELADGRDKRRLILHDRRAVSLETIVGPVRIRRNYYRDRQTGDYIFLLDRYLSFNGQKHFSPAFEQWALTEAVTCSSYRQAAAQIQQFLGYRAASHEGIRQQVLTSRVQPITHPLPMPAAKVLFFEVDGLYTSRQKPKGAKKPVPGKEARLVSVYGGWKPAPKADESRLEGARYYYHNDPKRTFWQGTEDFINQAYQLDGRVDFVINGDGARWIRDGRQALGATRTLYHGDRFHLARELRRLMKGRPGYKAMAAALRVGAVDRLCLALDKAIGTMETDDRERQLADLIRRLRQQPTAFGDFKAWLKAHGHRDLDLAAMRRPGGSESLMSRVARRMKTHRSWSDRGYDRLQQLLFAAWNGQTVVLPAEHRQFRLGTASPPPLSATPFLSKTGVRKAAAASLGEVLPYLRQSAGTPIHRALQALSGLKPTV